MRTSTTATEIRGIMKRHNDGMSVDEISAAMFIDPDSVQCVVTARTTDGEQSEAVAEVVEE